MIHRRTPTLYSPGTAGNVGVYLIVAAVALLHVLDLTSTPALVRVFRSPGGVGAWALLTTVAALFGATAALIAQTRRSPSAAGWIIAEGYAAMSGGLLFGLYALGVILDREAVEPLLSKQLVVAVGLTATLLARAVQIALSDLPTVRDKRTSHADPPAPGSPDRTG